MSLDGGPRRTSNDEFYFDDTPGLMGRLSEPEILKTKTRKITTSVTAG